MPHAMQFEQPLLLKTPRLLPKAPLFSFGRDIDVDTRVTQRWVTVTATYELKTDLPLVGRLVPDLTLSSDFSMLLEPPIG
jgi:hypothetical protein